MPVKKSKDVPVWDKPDPTKTEDTLSKKKKASAKARAARAGRPYPNLVDNMAVSKGLPSIMRNGEYVPSDILRRMPRESLVAQKLRADQYGKQAAKYLAKTKNANLSEGVRREYAHKFNSSVSLGQLTKNPNAKSVKKDDQASLKISGKIHRIYREKNGDIVVNHAGSKKQNGKYDKINLSDMAGVKSVKGGVKATANWHKEHPHTDVKKFDTPAWTRSEGKNPNGGLNAKGRASAKAEGHNLKPPVKSGDNPRRASFLARMSGNPGPEHKPNGEPTRLLLSLQKWGASSKEDAKRKAAAMSKSWETVSKVFPQPAILREGSRRTRVMVTHVHATGKPHLGIIHPQRGQEITHRDNLTFIKNKASKPKAAKPVQLDLFGEPLKKSMEYSVVMNQSRFGGASAVGKAYVEKADKAHYADKLLQEVTNLAGQINQKAPQAAYKKGMRAGMRHNAKVLVPLGAVGGSAVTAAGMTAHNRRKREPMPVVVIKADEPTYDQMGQPVQQKKRNPLSNMSGNAKLGTAGGAIGLVGAKRMAFAGTLPGKLKAQADAAEHRVKFEERMATAQNGRVQQAATIRNPITRRRQVRMHGYYADKAASNLASAEGKKIMADNALKAAPAKKLAHLKSGGALVATGAALGGLAAYNNAKERKTGSKVK